METHDELQSRELKFCVDEIDAVGKLTQNANEPEAATIDQGKQDEKDEPEEKGSHKADSPDPSKKLQRVFVSSSYTSAVEKI